MHFAPLVAETFWPPHKQLELVYSQGTSHKQCNEGTWDATSGSGKRHWVNAEEAGHKVDENACLNSCEPPTGWDNWDVFSIDVRAKTCRPRTDIS